MAAGVWVLGALAAGLAAGAASLAQRPRAPAMSHLRKEPAGKPASTTDAGLLRLGAALGAGLVVLLMVSGAVGLVGAVVAGTAVWHWGRRWESAAVRSRRRALEVEVPHVVDLLVSALHVGAAPAEALDRVAAVTGGPMGEELQSWLARLRLGADPVAVWRGMASHPQLGRLGATLARSAESGAPVAEALRRLADELRERAQSEVETRVRQVEVKATVPLGVCLLPAFVLTGVVPLVAGAAVQLLG